MSEHDHDKHSHANRTEEFRVSGEDLLKKVRELIAQGNIRRIIIKAKDGKTLLELPLTVGVAGVAALAVLAPVLAAVGAIAALVTECSVVVERTVSSPESSAPKPSETPVASDKPDDPIK